MGFFVGIGAQKAGTTWLADYLAAHPQVFLAPDKEMHYFDAVYGPERCRVFHERKRELLKQYERLPGLRHPGRAALVESLQSRLRMEHDESEYVAYFRRKAGEARAFGEITPGYCVLDERGFRAVLRLFPEARFLFLLRNPADRFWSQLRQRMRHTQAALSGDLIQSMLADEGVLLRADYRRTLEELERVVQPDRVLVLFCEHLFGPDGEAQLRRVTDFLGLDSLAPEMGRVLNQGQRLDMPPEYRAQVVQELLPVYDYVRRRFGDLPQNWLDDLEPPCLAAPPSLRNINASDRI